MDHDCQQQELLREMSGDIKMLLTEFKNMNGRVESTSKQVEEHCIDADPYRRKVDTIWTILHFSKWMVLLIFGSGLVFNLVKYMFIKGG